MDTMIDKVCSFIHNNIVTIIAIIFALVCLHFTVKAAKDYNKLYLKHSQAKEYIRLLEEDAGEDYILDVASSTDEYQDYYNY